MAHARKFPLPPEGLSPLPEPAPLPRRSPHDRLALALTDIGAASRELRIIAHDLESPLAYRSVALADRLDSAVGDTFQGVFDG